MHSVKRSADRVLHPWGQLTARLEGNHSGNSGHGNSSSSTATGSTMCQELSFPRICFLSANSTCWRHVAGRLGGGSGSCFCLTNKETKADATIREESGNLNPGWLLPKACFLSMSDSRKHVYWLGHVPAQIKTCCFFPPHLRKWPNP